MNILVCKQDVAVIIHTFIYEKYNYIKCKCSRNIPAYFLRPKRNNRYEKYQ